MTGFLVSTAFQTPGLAVGWNARLFVLRRVFGFFVVAAAANNACPFHRKSISCRADREIEVPSGDAALNFSLKRRDVQIGCLSGIGGNAYNVSHREAAYEKTFHLDPLALMPI